MTEKYSIFNKNNIMLSMDFKIITRLGDEKNDLMAIVYGKNPKALRDFYHYCAKENSQLNLLCLLAINDYTRFPSWDKLHFIVNNFIKIGSSHELNIGSKSRNEFMKLYELAQTELRRSTRSNAFANQNPLKNKLPKILPPVKIFETPEIESNVYVNLGETYGRYELKNVLSGSFMNKDITYVANASEKEVSKEDIVMIRSMLFAGFNTLDVLLK